MHPVFPPSLLAIGGEPALEIRDLLIILAAAGVVALILSRLRLAIIPAYLVTGALIGPGGLQWIESPENVRAISDLALTLLLFGIGLHMDLSVLRHDLRRLVTAGCAAVLFTFVALLPFSHVLADDTPTAIAVAMAMTMSSTAVVLRILQQRRELQDTAGRLAFATLIVQDLAAIAALMLLPPLARWQGTFSPEAALVEPSSLPPLLDLARSGALAAAVIALLVLIGRFVMPRLLLEAARQRGGEAMIVVATAAALGAAAATSFVGISPALGAFLVGFLLSNTPFRHHLSGQIGTLRDLFSAVFFTAIGMAIVLTEAFQSLPVILLGAGILLVIKTLAIALALWLSGTTGNTGVGVGLVLSQSGEFGLIILSAARADQIMLVPDDVNTILIATIILTLMVTPSLITWSNAIACRLPQIPQLQRSLSGKRMETIDDLPASVPVDGVAPTRVIVAGYGLVGRVVADSLMNDGAEVTIVELNPETVHRQRKLGRRIIYGDIANADVLESAHAHEADALILTIPDEQRVLQACHVARSENPDIFIIARTGFVGKGMEASGLGANAVVVEELATAQAMEREVAERLGGILKKEADSRKGDGA